MDATANSSGERTRVGCSPPRAGRWRRRADRGARVWAGRIGFANDGVAVGPPGRQKLARPTRPTARRSMAWPAPSRPSCWVNWRSPRGLLKLERVARGRRRAAACRNLPAYARNLEIDLEPVGPSIDSYFKMGLPAGGTTIVHTRIQKWYQPDLDRTSFKRVESSSGSTGRCRWSPCV